MFSHIVCGVVTFCAAMSRGVKACGTKLAAFAVVSLVCAAPSFAQSGPTLPDLGIDPADYIPLASAAVAAIALVAIGYKIGWKVLFRGLGWIGRALSPR